MLVGHSMGARAAIRAAGHPAVSAVAGLAPWLPSGEPVAQLAGRRVLLAHGTSDSITSPADTWAYAERARAVTEVAAIEIRDGDHPMLRRARLWHAIAAEFARAALGLPVGQESLARRRRRRRPTRRAPSALASRQVRPPLPADLCAAESSTRQLGRWTG